MKNRFLLFILSLFLINTAIGQGFRTPSLTGNVATDFMAAEKMSTGSGLTYAMTWDATNLYLGVGGSGAFVKNEPTLAYFDTDPFLPLNSAANTGSISGYNNYDGRTGSFPYNANVVIYMKANYAEIRTTTAGAWGASTNITPAVVTGANDIEITIPWSSFPGGVRPPAMLSTFFKTNGFGGTDAYGVMPGDTYIGNVNTTPFAATNYATTFSTANGAMSNTFSATCMPPKLEANMPLTIDFNDYRGGGFANAPLLGQLCNNTWAATGLSDGAKTFGSAAAYIATGDHARGVTLGNVVTGGFYGLDRGTGNHAFWIQPGGSDFTTGAGLTLKVQNTTGVTLTGVNIMYDMLELNDVATRASTFNGSFSTDGTTFTPVAALAHSTGLAAVAGITTTAKNADVTGVSIPNNGFFYIRWNSADVAGGSGSRDEFGFDNLKISACGIAAVAATAPSCSCGNANFGVSFTAFSPNSGSFKVINNATNAVLATGTSPINVSVPSTVAGSLAIRIEDASNPSCKSNPISVTLPACTASPATVSGSAVASIVGAAAGQYFIIFNSANGGDCAPYNVTINGVTQVYTTAPLTFGLFNHSTSGGPGFYAVTIDDADADMTADATVQVTEAFSTGTAAQQNTTFCDCSINTATPLTNGPAGAIMAQSQPGTFQSGGASGQTQVYLAVLGGNIVSVSTSGLHKGLANGSYQVYALNYLTADAATLAPLLVVGQPITGLTAPTGAAAAACFNLSAPAPFTVACTSVPMVTNLTPTVCANATTVNLTLLESQIGATGGIWTDATNAAVATPAAAVVSATTSPFKYRLNGTNTCFNTATVTYTIVPNPAAPAAPAAITVCEGASTLISMPSPGASVTSPASLSWAFPMSSLLGTSSNTAAVNVGAATVGSGVVANGFPTGCPSPTGNAAYSANNWITGIGDEASAVAQNKYFEFPINTLGGNSFDITSVKFDMQRSATGPTNFAIYIDGVKAGSTAVYFTASTCNSFTFTGFTRPVGINAASKVRIYAWGSTGASGTFRVDNFTIDGTVKPFAASAYNFYSSNPATPGATLLAGNTGSYNPNTTPATSPQTIWITEVNASGCESPAVSVVVTVKAKPTVMLSSSTSPVCSTDKGVINLITTGTPTLTYTWATVGGGGIVAGAQNQTSLNPGTYSVTVTDGNTPACTATLSGLVISTASDVTAPTVVVKNITRSLNALVFISPADINDGTTDNVTAAGALTLSVTPNSFDCSKIGNQIVTFTATDACGNSASKTATVTILDGSYCNASVATSIADPCSCKNNATTIKNGQFGEIVEAMGAAGMIFRVKSVSGLYTSAAPAPPTALGTTDLVAINTPLTLKAGTTTVYTLNGVHVDSLGYSITVERVDGAGMVIPMSEMTISNKCYYPTPIFNIDECYNIASPAVALTATEKNGGAVVNTFKVDGTIATSFNPATLGIGSHTIELTQDAAAYTTATGQNPPLSDPGCIQPLTKVISVVNPTLVCRDKIDISLSNANDCTMPFTASTALANTAVCGIGAYTTMIMNGSNPLGNVINATMIGQTLTYKVTAPDGNSCWGTILVEDKQAPQLTCPAAPVEKFCDETAALAISLNVEKTLTSALQTALSVSILEKCAPYSATYSDVLDTKPCADPLSAVITRNIKAFDNYGNTSTCAVTINIRKRTFADILPPTAKTYSNCNVVVNGTVPTTTSGVPTIAGNPIYPSFSSYCGFTVDFNDKKVNTCGNSFDIVRTWKVFDNCSGAYTTTTQTIIVLDKVAPTINNCPTGTLALAANGDKCDVDNYTIKLPTATDDCSATAPVVTARVLDASNNVVAVNTVNNVSVGAYTVVYTATDACGNTATCSQAMTIEDKTPPVMVCDLDTKVDLTQDCKAIVNAVTFDDGSSDNCCFDVNSLLVARMGGTFATTIQFTQADCAAPVMVQLQGKDCWGNTNVCMVNVVVEDKIAPVAFGRDTTVCCGSGPSATSWLNNYILPKKSLIDYPNATNPGWYDNCGATPSREQSGSIDNCGNGTITHKWTITDDKNGTKASTNVNYISENRSAYTVTFPEDVTLTCKDNKQYASDPSTSGAPDIKTLGKTCPLVGVEYTDEVFKVVPDACFKIIRTWKILNWCQPLATNIAGAAGRGDERRTGGACTVQARTFTNINELRPNGSSVYAVGAPCKPEMDAVKAGESCYAYDTDGYMEYVQIIKVIDVTPPSITAGNITIGEVGKECKVVMTIEKPSGSDCTGTPTFSYQIVKKSNNALIVSGANFPTVREFAQADFGDYIVRYIANDNCGNLASSDVAVTIADKKKPTPICHNALSVELMATGMVMVDAKAFDAGSYDNCGAIAAFGVQIPSPGADASYDATKVTPQAIFNCKGIQTVALWVKDTYGNWDYCETYVEINNNMNVPNVPICSPNLGPVNAPKISANVKTENGFLASADLTAIVNGQLPGIKKLTQGGTLFIVQKGVDVKILAENNSNPLNGVSTLDLVLMSKHILGTQPIASKYAQMAADVNNSGTISTADIVELRKMILGIQSNFSKNTSWRFFDSNMKEEINFKDVQTDVIADFTAVKIGDINGNASSLTAPRYDQTVYFDIEDKKLKIGEEYKVILQNNRTEGFQFSLNFDDSALELIDLDKNSTLIENGIINTAQIDGAMEITFRAKQNTVLSKAIQIGNNIRTEVVLEGKGANAALKFNSQTAEMTLFQNRPNPFTDATLISFNMPTTENARLIISDISGKVVKTIEKEFAKGYNEVSIGKADLGTTGVFYYRLETATSYLTKKMIVVE